MDKLYRYYGPVYHYESVITNIWDRCVSAPSFEKALYFLEKLYRQEHGLLKNYELRLDIYYLEEVI